MHLNQISPMSISITTHLNQEKMHTKTFHRRHDSGELEVFEAAGYFSSYNEVSTDTSSIPQKSTTRGGKLSLDMPSTRNTAQMQPNKDNDSVLAVDKPQVDHAKEIISSTKKYKQPSSPGGKLASFLNSLFNQNDSKKKKPKSIITAKSLKDHPIINNINDGDDLRKKRRSSISHFPASSSTSFNTTTTATTNTNDSSRSFYHSSTSSAGFRPSSPPIYANTPAKGHVKDLRCYSKKTNFSLDADDKFMFTNSTISETNVTTLKNQNWVMDKCSSSDQDQKEYKVFSSMINGEDDGAESDSSSDLFELQNCEVGSFSSGNLPVYETTKLDHFKRPNSNDIVV